MQANRSYWKALHSLSHPISIMAILLLLFNDHYLRHHYPSWLTGKLGDFSWLVFAPFIAAMLFSCLSPKNPRLIGGLSIAFIGLWFASFKTIPFVMDLTKDVLETLVGWRGTLGMDASDLLTLPALRISWLIWKNAAENSRYLRPVLYVAFALGIMGTLASDYIISNIQAINTICELPDGKLQTFSSEYAFDTEAQEAFISAIHLYESINGGYGWQYLGQQDVEIVSSFTIPDARCSDTQSLSTSNPQNGILYRWERGERIEYSVDNGQSWLLLRDLFELRQDARNRLNHDDGMMDYSTEYVESPVSGIVHNQTGNLVLAMSRDGVLVISPNGESDWVAVGEYQLVELYDLQVIQKLLGMYQIFLPTLFFIILVSAIVMIHSKRLLMRLWLGLGWLNWLILQLPFIWGNVFGDLPSSSTDGLLLWAILALGSLALIGIPMSLWALYHLLWHYRSAILPIAIAGVMTCLGNIFPMFLWSQGTIPRYDVAMLFSLGMTATVLASCYAYFRPKLPSRFIPEKEKRKNDDA